MIWLLRHAEAADGSPDAERPLTERGEGQARTVGGALAALGVEIDACLTSPMLRAEHTARLVCEALGVGVTVESALQGGPFDPDELAAGLGEEVLMVGHDPDFSMAVHRLTGAQVRMKKGGIAVVHKGELKLLLRPQELALIARAARRTPA
ncbi:MAG: SixA phosphatase family protein [Solirubrobacteraceae bacterium]